MRFTTELAAALYLLLSGASICANEIHVYSGESIQAAIIGATNDDEIIVHPGTYNESIDFLGKAINVHSSDGSDVTILDGTGIFTSVVTFAGTEGSDSILEGFTITNGNASNGGGMLIAGAGPTIRDCIFRENSAEYGGGVFNSHGTPMIVGCTFEHNAAQYSGGGMYNFAYPGQPGATLTDCYFSENTAENYGGGMRNWDSSPTITDCTFYYNHIRYRGAGVANGGESHPFVMSCLFDANRTDTLFANWDGYGGGLYNAENSSPILVNCIFHTNTVVAMNPWLSRGGAIANMDNASPAIINCTMAGNHANLGDGLFNGDSAVPTLANSILWHDNDEILNENMGGAHISYCDIKNCGGSGPGWDYDLGNDGGGNIEDDPLFVNYAGRDLHLMPDSPCIDAGDNSAVPPGGVITDFEGNSRFVDDPETDDTGNGTPPIVDIGAYEYQIPCPADLTGDDQVNIDDIFAVLGLWGDCPDPCPPYCVGDLTEDCAVNIDDIFAILGQWGPCE